MVGTPASKRSRAFHSHPVKKKRQWAFPWSPQPLVFTGGKLNIELSLFNEPFELQFASPLSGRLNANGPGQCKAAPLLTRSDTEPLTVIIPLDNFQSLWSHFMATTWLWPMANWIWNLLFSNPKACNLLCSKFRERPLNAQLRQPS